MSNGKYEAQILEAIQILVDNAVSKAEYDKTIQGTVSRCVDKTIGKYIIKYQDSSFYAYSSNTDVTYPAGTQVYVLVPGNNMANEKSIIGTVDRLGPDYVSIIEGENGYEVVGVNTVSSDTIFELCSYKIEEAKILYDRDNSINLIDLDTFGIEKYIKESNSIICGATFKTKLPAEQRFRGNYGIGFNLDFIDNATGETVTRSYIVDVDQMTGNPYNYSTNTRQYGIFDVDGSNFISVKQIYLFEYDFPNTEDNKPNDIFISKVELSAANALNAEEASTCALTFVTPQGTYFDETNLDTDVKTLEAQVRIKGNAIDNNSQLVNYYWFKENNSITTKSEKYNQYGGAGWECLNDYSIIQNATDDTETLVQWTNGNYKYITKKADNVAKETTYKCVAVYSQDTVLSKTIIIYNYDSNYEITIKSDSGVAFNFDNGAPTLTCYINGEEQTTDDYKYIWSEINSSNQFKVLEETEAKNIEYNAAVVGRDAIMADAAAEKLISGTEQEQLITYNNIIEQYQYIMRVEENKIYKLKINNITNFSTYRCSVYKSGVFIGTASIIITNTLKNDAMYTLVIDNGDQVFKYNEAGIAPTSGSVENPQKIMPLSFTLYDEKGQKINWNAIGKKNISWTVPKANESLILIPASYGNPSSETAETETYTGYEELNFNILSNYNPNKEKNQIQLTINYKDKIISAKTNLTFVKEGENGTNGTEFICKIVPNNLEGTLAPKYPVLYYDEITKQFNLNYSTTQDKWFKVQLWKDGERVFEGTETGQSPEGKQAKVTWSILANEYGDNNRDTSNFLINSNSGVVDFQSNELENPANIFKCVVNYNDVDYYATMPLTLIRIFNNDIDVQLLENSGFRYAMYSADGRNPAYDNQPFEIKVYQTSEGGKNDISVFKDSEYAIDYDWNVVGNVCYSEWQSEQNLVKNILWESQENRNQKYFKPIDIYNGLCVNNAITCEVTRGGNRLALVHIPIHLYINRYGNAAMNGWDGNSISLDEEGGIILAPQVGAGTKNDDNTFTGVFMGSVKEAGQPKEEHGLFGYNAGQRTFNLNAEDGSARFGVQGQGQIIIDPSTGEAKLTSGNYDEDAGTGMEINLSEPSIKFGSGKFKVDPDGTVHADEFVTNDEFNEIVKVTEDLESSISLFTIDMTADSILIPTDANNYPIENSSYTVSFNGKFKGKEVVSYTEKITSGSVAGITTAFGNNQLTFTVDKTKAIANTVNIYTVEFTYADVLTMETYVLTKDISIGLAIQGKDGVSGEPGVGVTAIENYYQLSSSNLGIEKTVIDTDIEIADSVSTEAKELIIYGNNEQVTKTGRNLYPEGNLFNISGFNGALDENNKLNGYNSIRTNRAWEGPRLNLQKIIQDNNLQVGDTVTYSIYFKTNFTPVKENGKITFTLYRATNSASSGQVAFYLDGYQVGEWYRISVPFTLNEYSLTSAAARIEVEYWDASDPYYFGNDRTNYMWFACPQFEVGDLTDFEDYTGGTPSPNPDYPQEIEVVKGKNLFTTDGLYNIDSSFIYGALDKNTFKIIYDDSSTNRWKSVIYRFTGLKKNTDYYFDYKKDISKITTSGSNTQYIKIKGLDTDTIFYELYTGYLTSFNTGENTNIEIDISTGGTTHNGEIIIYDIQLEEGLTATNFIPYGNIETKITGKNLLNITPSMKTMTRNGITMTIGDDGLITLDGTATANLWPDFIWKLSLNTSPKDYCKYYFNETITNSTFSMRVVGGSATSSRTIQASIGFNDGENYVYKTVNANSSLNIVNAIDGINRGWIYIANGEVFDNYQFYLQLEKGNVATEYEPYKENYIDIDLQDNELVKVGDVKDELDIKNGILTKRIGKKILTGDESGWELVVSASTEDSFLFQLNIHNQLNNYNINAISNYFTGISASSNWLNTSGNTISINADGALQIRTSSFTTVDELKAWLSENNLEVYYVLATPEQYQLDSNEIKLFTESNNINTLATIDTESKLTYYTNTDWDLDSDNWTTSVPTLTKEQPYLWSYQEIKYTDNTSAETDPGVIGVYGDSGIGVDNIVEQYYLSTSSTEPSGGSWLPEQQPWSSGKYIWTRSEITWTDGSITWTEPVLAQALNKANETASSANINANSAVNTANTANQNATTAVNTANTAKTEAENATSTANTANTNATAALNKSNQTAIDLSNLSTTVTNEIADLQTQIDGSISTWFYNYEPAESNEPASSWTTIELKNQHLGDLFYIVDDEEKAGQCYRYALLNGVYKWILVEDADVTKALADAAKAQATADGKCTIFIEQPKPPYQVGDLWNRDGKQYTCTTARPSGIFNESDWELLLVYTDDTAANEAKDLANNAQTSADSANTKIDNLEIGGKNLFLNSASSSQWNSSGGGANYTYTYVEDSSVPSGDACQISIGDATDGFYCYLTRITNYPNTNIKKGDTVTVSIYQKSNTNLTVGKMNCEFLSNISFSKIPNLSTEWQRYIVTGIANKDLPASSSEAITFYYAKEVENNFELWLSSPKIEKGNKATDWSPAPEDIDNQITDVENTANQASSDAATANQTANSAITQVKGTINKVEIEYAKSTSSTEAPTSGWSTTSPTWEEGTYIWSRQKMSYIDTSITPTYGKPVCITGNTGAEGKTGLGIKTTTIEYAIGTSGTETPTTGWSAEIPTVPANQYLWTKILTTLTDDSTTESYSVAKMGNGISDVINYYKLSSSSAGTENTKEGTFLNIEDAAAEKVKNITLKGSLFQSNRLVPKEYQQVEYIESTGTQYIDTDFKGNNNTGIILKVSNLSKVSEFGWLYGSRIDNTSQFHLIIASSYADASYGTLSYQTGIIDGILNNNNAVTIKQNKNVFEGWGLTNTFGEQTFDSGLNMYLFAANNNGTALTGVKARLYSAQITNNGTTVRNFIPCYRKSDNIVGLYDLTNNVFYVNKGTGAFIKGPDITVPTPDYPRAFKSVSNNNYVVKTNKNLYEVIDGTQTSNGITTVRNASQGTLTFSGTVTTNWANIDTHRNIVFPAGKYTLSINNPIPYQLIVRFYYREDGRRLDVVLSPNQKSITFTFLEPMQNFYSYIGLATGTVIPETTIKLQLECGEQATEIVNHKKTSYLAALGLNSIYLREADGYRDYIWKDLETGKWYVKYLITRYLFTGDETWMNLGPNWPEGENTKAFIYYPGNLQTDGNETISHGYCNYFVSKPRNPDLINDVEQMIIAGVSETYITFRIRKDRLAGTEPDDLKQWLKDRYDEGNPVEIFCRLKAPVDTEITNTTLIAQLEDILNLQTDNGINNIYGINHYDENPYLDMTYYQDVNLTNWQGDDSWSAEMPTMTEESPYLWNYQETVFDDGQKTVSTPGIIGAYGKSGTGIKEVINYYLATNQDSRITTATSGWTTTIQDISTAKPYLWNYEVIKYNDDTADTVTEPCIIGRYGSDGTSAYVYVRYSDDNLTFTSNNGHTIGSYMGICSTSSATEPASFNSYTWSQISDYAGLNKWRVDVYTRTNIGDNSTSPTEADFEGETLQKTFLVKDSQLTTWGYGDDFLAKMFTYIYCPNAFTFTSDFKSDDASTIYLNGTQIKTIASVANTSVTLNFVQGWNEIKVLLNEHTGSEYAAFATKLSEHEKVAYMTGIEEEKNRYGADGKTITNVKVQFYLSTSKTTLTGGSWSDTAPTWSSGKYLWTKNVITYANPASTSETTPVCDSSWEAVNEIEVGGRNFILNSDKWSKQLGAAAGITPTIENDGVLKVVSETGNSNWLSFIRDNIIEDNFQEGDKFTFSMEIKSEDGTEAPKVYFKSGMGYYAMSGTVGTEYSTVYYTGTWKDANGISLHLGWSSAIGTYYIRKIKFERGNKPTDWSPAIEDTQAEMNNLVILTENQFCIGSSVSTPPAEDDEGWTTGLIISNINTNEFLWTRIKNTRKSGEIFYSEYSCMVYAQKELVEQSTEYILSTDAEIQPALDATYTYSYLNSSGQTITETRTWSTLKPELNQDATPYLWTRQHSTFKYTGATVETLIETYDNYSRDTSWNQLFDLTSSLNGKVQSILTNMSTGYVRITSEAIAIGDNKENPTHLIIMNHNGIAFFNNETTPESGVGKAWPSNEIIDNATSAWSIDGTMDMQEITVKNLDANDIENQTLRLGKSSSEKGNVSGDLDIYDSQGHCIFETVLDSNENYVMGFKIHKYIISETAYTYNGYIYLSREFGLREYDADENLLYGNQSDGTFISKTSHTNKLIISTTTPGDINSTGYGIQIIPMEVAASVAPDGKLHKGIAFLRF